MLRKPPLQLYLLSHPRSASANSIAAALMRHFMEPPAGGGLRIPVRFTPERDDDLPPAVGNADGIQ